MREVHVTGLQFMCFNDPNHGEVLVAAVVPRGDDPWGILAPLRKTVPWGSLIREVSGESLSHARHGWATPLMREIGPHPRDLARRVSIVEGLCAQRDRCAAAGPHCRPGPKLPDCYDPPNLEGEAQMLAASVALLWREGRYVLIVLGQEFSLS